MSFCEHCTQGVRHEGTPEGTYETIGDIKTYVAKPTADFPKNKAVLFLTDVFGLELPNNLLLIDDFAKNGFQVYAPDLFEGDPAPAEMMVAGKPFDLMAWFPNHSPEHTGKRVRAVIAGLKEQGIDEFAATGYCYGGRLVFDLAFDGLIKVAASSHPSLLQLEDIDKYATTAKAPLLINACEVDGQWPKEKQDKANEVLKNFAPGFSQPYFAGCTHGFSVRGDLNDPKVKAGKEGAFKNTVEWFIKHL
ncbi:Alpha/Beta hydrolase protein [Amylostereum chailletii]|nr:Alpha/Beta hydrolase protein [Amylostereum chailletii]